MITPTILAFETSCDETAVAVVRGTEVLSNVLSSQVDLHARFGGVVPEVASRAHVEAIRGLTHRALQQAGVHPADLDAVAATEPIGRTEMDRDYFARALAALRLKLRAEA